MHNQPGFHGIIPPVNQGNAMRGARPDLSPNMGPRNYAMSPSSFVGSGYPGVPGLQYQTYPGGMLGHRPLNNSPGSVSPAVANSNSLTSSSGGTGSGGQIEGLLSIYSVQYFCLLMVYLGGLFC